MLISLQISKSHTFDIHKQLIDICGLLRCKQHRSTVLPKFLTIPEILVRPSVIHRLKNLR